MGGKQPLTIMTDQDKAMRLAIHKVFSNSRHRLCSWHLEKNCMQRVRVFTTDFPELLKSNLSIDEFETKWVEVTEKHGVVSNDWVVDEYLSKESWCEAYFRGHFTSIMKSNQRVESVNSIFKQQNHPGFNLTELIKYYHKVVGRMRVACTEAQQLSEAPKPPLSECVLRSLQEHAQKIYSKRIFSFVQSEIYAEQGLLLRSYKSVDDRLLNFSFVEYGVINGREWDVEIDCEDGNFMCDCLGLESEGFPCRHLFSAFKYMHLKYIPAPCIRERWTINVAEELRRKFTCPHADGSPQLKKCKRILSATQPDAKRTKNSMVRWKRVLKKVLQKMMGLLKKVQNIPMFVIL